MKYIRDQAHAHRKAFYITCVRGTTTTIEFISGAIAEAKVKKVR